MRHGLAAQKEKTAIKSYAEVEAMVQKQVDKLAGSVSVAVVMGSVNGHQANRIADGLISAWTHEK